MRVIMYPPSSLPSRNFGLFTNHRPGRHPGQTDRLAPGQHDLEGHFRTDRQPPATNPQCLYEGPIERPEAVGAVGDVHPQQEFYGPLVERLVDDESLGKVLGHAVPVEARTEHQVGPAPELAQHFRNQFEWIAGIGHENDAVAAFGVGNPEAQDRTESALRPVLDEEPGMEQRVALGQIGGQLQRAVAATGIDDENLGRGPGTGQGGVEILEGLCDRRYIIQCRDDHRRFNVVQRSATCQGSQ